MAKFRKIYSSVWEKQAKKSIFGQILAKNVRKIENENFPANFFSSLFKTPKNRFLWQKSGKFIVALGRNGPKTAFLAKNGQILAKKRAQNRKREFSCGIFFRHFLKDQKQVPMAQIRKIIVAFGRNGPKRAFLAKNGQKNENENFRQKSETSQI